jgi:phosphoribosyl-AMP cyclohydrolase / phosphoribosyl-ATP pyrophosphohydrolase
MTNAIIQNVRFDERGLIPAIAQDAATLEVLALCYLDNATLVKMLQAGETSHFARAIPSKGAQSFRLLDVRVNGDGESLTVMIEREVAEPGASPPVSLYREVNDARKRNANDVSLVDLGSMEFGLAVNDLYSLIADRKDKRPEGSYTTYLFDCGLDKILKKIAEESGEVIIASKNRSSREIISELADLFYHLLVLMVERDVKLEEVRDELSRRAAPQKQ